MNELEIQLLKMNQIRNILLSIALLSNEKTPIEYKAVLKSIYAQLVSERGLKK